MRQVLLDWYNVAVLNRRYNRLIAFFLLLSACFSTEVAEQWCNSSVRAEIIGCSGNVFVTAPTAKINGFAQVHTPKQVSSPTHVAASGSDSSIIDIPSFCFSHAPLSLMLPTLVSVVVVTTMKLFPRAVETRGPPQIPAAFVILTLRAPPAA